MTVKSVKYKNNRYKSHSDYLYIFSDSEALTVAILFLYRQKSNLKSSLYKFGNEYHLIITSNTFVPCLLTLQEYCQKHSKSIFEIEFTKEHAKPLILKNAVRIYGKHFFKGF